MLKALSIVILELAVCAGSRAEESATRFDEVIVTATRTASTRDRALAPVIVIGREEIERSLALDVADLLRFHAGLDIARNGGPGQPASVFIRGAESNHTLVLVDGVKINPGTLGGAALQNIATNLVERIEIVKGPRSSLYGSEAIGGVINVITRDAASGGRVTGSAGGGHYGTREAAVATGVMGNNATLGLSASRLETDGFPTLRASPVDRGYDNLSFDLDASMAFDGATARLRHWQAEGTSEYVDFFGAPLDQDFANRATSLEMTGPLTPGWTSRLNLSRILDDIRQNQNMDFVRTRRDVLEWQNDFKPGDGQLIVAGVYLSDEETSGLSFGAPLEERMGRGGVGTGGNALFIEDSFELGRHSLLAAARHTRHETFGDATTWNLEYGLGLGSATRLTASAGTGFRAPDSIDRYGFGGNPNLEPERSRNYELGMRHDLDPRQRLSLSLFQNEIEDLIEFITLSTDPFMGENRNIERARIRGIEAGYELHGDLWRLQAAAVVQDADNVTEDMRLPRRAEKSLTINLARSIGAHEVGLNLLAAGDRQDLAFPAPVDLGGYVLLDLTARLALGNRWSLRGRLGNALDTDYETVSGYNSAGRGLYLRLELRL